MPAAAAAAPFCKRVTSTLRTCVPTLESKESSRRESRARSVVANTVRGAIDDRSARAERLARLKEAAVRVDSGAAPLHARIETTAAHADKTLFAVVERTVVVLESTTGSDAVGFLEIRPVSAIVRAARCRRREQIARHGAYLVVGDILIASVDELKTVAEPCASACLTRCAAVRTTRTANARQTRCAIAGCRAVLAER